MKNILLLIIGVFLNTGIFAADEIPAEERTPYAASEGNSENPTSETLNQDMLEAFGKFCDGLTQAEKIKLQESKGFTSLEAPESAADDYWLVFYKSVSSLVRKGMSVEERVKLATLWYDIKENGEALLNDYKTATEGLSDKEVSITLNTVRNSAGFSVLVDKLKEAKAAKEEESKRAKKRNPFARSNSAAAVMRGASSAAASSDLSSKPAKTSKPSKKETKLKPRRLAK